MGFGNHLVRCHIQHGTAGKAQHHGQHGGRHRAQGKAHPNAHNLQQTDGQRNEERAHHAHASHQQRRNDDHTLGNVLQAQTQRNAPRSRLLLRARHADARRNALGQLVQSNGHDKEHHTTQACARSMAFRVEPRNMMQMGRKQVQHVKERRTAHHAQRHQPPHGRTALLKGGHNKPQRAGCQHDTGTIAQHRIIPFMRQLLDGKAQQGTQQSGGAQGRRTDPYIRHHIPYPFL